MDNEQFPGRADIPETNEEQPLIEDLSFLPEEALDAAPVEEIPQEAAPQEPVSEEAVSAEALSEAPASEEPVFAEALPEEAVSQEEPFAGIPEDFFPEEPVLHIHQPQEEAPGADAGQDFMSRIPEVNDGVYYAEDQARAAHYPPAEPESSPEDPAYDLSRLEQDILAAEAPMDTAGEIQEYRDSGQAAEPAPEPPAPEAPVRRRATRKGRPKRKKGEGLLGIPHILVTVVWLALIVVIGVTAGRMLWVCAADVLAFGREDKPVTVTVYESDTLEDITDKLYDAGLIRYKSLFDLYASISHAEKKIKPGIYDLNTRYDYHALVNFMTPRSNREVITLTIPEGYSCRQIFELLEENRVCTARDAAAYAASGELGDYWFLENVERGSSYCLEGFLFPDTYEFYTNSTPKETIQRMLDNFEKKFTEEMLVQLDSLNENVTGGGYTVREVVTVASLIEKESAAPAESPAIAGVIYNRLFRWDGTPAYLNIDASIIYAQDGDATTIDTRLDSPYNTYLHTGLTPTPIANPGLSSLQAALEPEMHGYYFYVLNPATGMHQFSATQEEHDAYIAEYYS